MRVCNIFLLRNAALPQFLLPPGVNAICSPIITVVIMMTHSSILCSQRCSTAQKSTVFNIDSCIHYMHRLVFKTEILNEVTSHTSKINIFNTARQINNNNNSNGEGPRNNRFAGHFRNRSNNQTIGSGTFLLLVLSVLKMKNKQTTRKGVKKRSARLQKNNKPSKHWRHINSWGIKIKSGEKQQLSRIIETLDLLNVLVTSGQSRMSRKQEIKRRETARKTY